MNETTPLHNIPEKWAWTTLGNIAHTTSGGTPLRSNKDYYNGDILWLKSGELNDSVVYSTEETITQEGLSNSSAKIFPKGTLLIALYGATAGKLAFLGVDSATNQAVCAIFPDEKIHQKYIYWHLKNISSDLLSKRMGGAQPNLSQRILSTIPIPIPPFPEQFRIVSKLEELFSKLDAAVKSLQTTKTQLERYKQSILLQVYNGRFSEKWRESHTEKVVPAAYILENIKEKNGNRSKRTQRRIESLEKYELSDIPETWVWTQLDKIGEVVTGRTPRKSIEEYYGDDYPFFKPPDLDAGYEVTTSVDGLSERGIRKAKLLPAETVLVTCIGATIGKTGFSRVEGASNQQINAIIPHDPILPKFVYWIVISPMFQNDILQNASATTLPIINKTKFRSLPFPLPPVPEQTYIVKEIERAFSLVSQIEKETSQSLVRAERLRQSTLKKAFEGKLVSQDPLDEPASELLIHIKRRET